jgi:hypothetical protein
MRPSARDGCAMTYHGASQRVMLLGGHDGNSTLSDTWEWDGTNWSQRTTPIAPNPRQYHVMADDEARGVVVLFGGNSNPVPVLDTWEWNGTAWSFRPVVGPQVLPYRMVYDRARRRIVLSGRHTNTGVHEIWEWNGTTWIQRTTPLVPSPGWMTFDPFRNRTVLYSGDTWEYGPTNPATFTPFGSGCAGSAGTPSLAADDVSLPWLADTFTLRITNLPPNAPGTMFVGHSNTNWGNVSLPFDLGQVGMPGCSLLTPPILWFPITASGGLGTADLPIPNDQSLLGGSFYCQGFVVDPPANPLGLTASNGGASRVGGK